MFTSFIMISFFLFDTIRLANIESVAVDLPDIVDDDFKEVKL